jgi:glutamate synthase (NADPH/NADH) small chain
MADPRGFMRYPRVGPARRAVEVRLRDWREVYNPFPKEDLTKQAARCMDCGIPFCHEGCPLGNLIPEWNDLVFRGRFDEASSRLHATNNFPEFTGRLCPAPCEGSCVLGISAEPVAIKQVEVEIAEWAAGEGFTPVLPDLLHDQRVAVIGSGPAGLAVAQQLTRSGYHVEVFERAERIGGLLRYGVPEFKLEKRVIDRRLAQMVAEGTVFHTRVAVGAGSRHEVSGAAAPDATIMSLEELRSRFDAIVLAVGSTRPRDLAVPGRDLGGIHFAMDYLKASNLYVEGTTTDTPITAKDKRVVIIGGGDTGADCLGTVHRQGAFSVSQLEILPEPPNMRLGNNPWPTWPLILRSSAAHEEGGDRLYSISTTQFLGNAEGNVTALRVATVERDSSGAFLPVAESEMDLPADLVLLALGFTGPEHNGVVRDLGCALTPRGNLEIDRSFMTTVPGVFACGDAARGQSLVVWAIAEGRSVARAVDHFLSGASELPAPIVPGQVALA